MNVYDGNNLHQIIKYIQTSFLAAYFSFLLINVGRSANYTKAMMQNKRFERKRYYIMFYKVVLESFATSGSYFSSQNFYLFHLCYLLKTLFTVDTQNSFR